MLALPERVLDTDNLSMYMPAVQPAYLFPIVTRDVIDRTLNWRRLNPYKEIYVYQAPAEIPESPIYTAFKH